MDHGAVCIEVDLSDLRAFERQRALLGRMAKQQFIQLGAPNLPSRVLRRIPTLGKFHVAAVVEIGRDEFNAELRHADSRDLILDAKSIEKLDIPRQQRLADVKAGMMVFLEEDDPSPLPCGERRHRRACRPAPDDQNVAIVSSIH